MREVVVYPNERRSPIHRFFAGLAEQTFESRLGVCDPPLIDYITQLLVRFIETDAVFGVRDLAGRRLDQVAAMLAEAEARIGKPRRDVHRHIGDFTLFWTGVYPEALRRLQHRANVDHLLEYQREGKRSYYLASTIPDPEDDPQSEILQRLSHDFELCQYGLSEVRREWERRDPDGGTFRSLLVN
jgi:hypothetical protein